MQVLKNGLNSPEGSLPDGSEFDLVVIGAGGAGLSAAVFAAMDGARVLVVEHTEYVGGTTAWSAGTTWVPGTHHAAQHRELGDGWTKQWEQITQQTAIKRQRLQCTAVQG